MLQGSSAIQNIHTSTIASPVLRATIQENFHLENQLYGADLISRPDGIFGGIEFNNKSVLLEYRRAGSTYNFYLSSYNASGNSDNLNLLFSSPNTFDGTLRCDFVVTGNTLSFVYTGGTRVYALHSANGTAWGGSQLLYSGSTVEIIDVCAVTSNEFYMLKVGATNISNMFYYNSTTGASNTIFISACQNDRESDKKQLNGWRNQNLDYLLLTTTYRNDSKPLGECMYLLKSDTRNYFDLRKLTNSGLSTSVNMRNLSIGVSSIYTGLAVQTKRQVSAGTITSSAGYLLTFDRSGNLNAQTNSLISFYTLLAGATNQQGSTAHVLRFLTTSGGSYISTMVKNQTSVDISNDIISYDNQDNSRISLILGNKK